ncbi:M6 family metalloprotease domain-containing protein [Geobacter pelophilus]|uniref:M6 family metalloprotease domain-containing protein n=2 Tax=Geoanaerobacter pelophilus TaxID=60036 RepID=A0AAW4L2L1_9BACT|nr:M6 family metalloprotease domain-containing protein [Geoanaerobacter pelophilus]
MKVGHSGRYAPDFIPKGIRPDRDHDSEQTRKGSTQRKYTKRLTQINLAPVTPSRAAAAAGGTIIYPQSSGSISTPGPGDWVPAPESGSKKLLIILVSFSDRAIQTLASDWYSALFDTTPNTKSVANFYKDNSFGALTITPVTHSQPASPPGVVQVSINRSHPYNYADTWANEQAWITLALNGAAPYVDFNSLDTDGDGLIETSEAVVYFIVAGYEESGSSKTPNVWAHAWVNASGAGKQFPDYAINGELNNAGIRHPIGIIVHELGHQMLGLPDLYDTSYTNAGMGNFSVMAGGSWGLVSGQYSGTTPVALDAWSREYLGWTLPITPSIGGSYLLGSALGAPDNALKLIKPSISSTEYWMMENRHPIGWDQGITGLVSGFSGGILVTHVDITAGTVGYNDINEYSVSPHQGVVPEQANSATCNMLASSCRGAATTTFYAGNIAAFGAATTPAANYYSGVASEIELKNISGRSSSMTFDLEFTAVPPVITEFAIPSGYGSLEVPINTFTASSTKPVTGYLVTESSSPPTISDIGWSSTPPVSYRFASAGSKVLYAWAKDLENNISASRSASVQVSIVSTATIQSSTTLQVAYDGADAIATLQAGAKIFTEHLVFNRSIAVTLDGGFDSSYQNKEGYTTLAGSLTIVQGSAVISDLIIK